ncbi:MAG TPA: stage III sporulation protein AG [Lachnospiraceae bacterium]|nr:stage III sporulation protein AG [Lachnospiraceae bacterium]
MSKIFDLAKGYKKNQKLGKDSFIILILFGILFLVVVIPTGTPKANIAQSTGTNKNVETKEIEETITKSMGNKGVNTTDTYINEMEQKLEEILSNMEGVGKVRVMITIHASKEEILEKDIPSIQSNSYEIDSDGGTRTITDATINESTVYITDSEGNKNPYVVKTIQPDISGVVVIAAGGGNDTICKNITEIIQALFGIEAHKIKVVKMKS